MSVAGTYQVQVRTPKGVQKGKMTLIVEGDLLKGTLEYSAGIAEIKKGIVKGNGVEFITNIKTPFGRLNASVTGAVRGNTFSGVAKLPIGSIPIDGIKL